MTSNTILAMPDEQRLEHMLRMNRLSAAKRGAKKELKERLQSGDLALHQLLIAPPDEVLDARISDVLTWGRYWGTIRSRPVMRGLVAGHERLGKLSPTTRRKLAARVLFAEQTARRQSAGARTRRAARKEAIC